MMMIIDTFLGSRHESLSRHCATASIENTTGLRYYRLLLYFYDTAASISCWLIRFDVYRAITPATIFDDSELMEKAAAAAKNRRSQNNAP